MHQVRLARLAAAARAAARTADDAREARDDAIEQADQAGIGVRAIGRACALAPSTVQKVIIDRAVARQRATETGSAG